MILTHAEIGPFRSINQKQKVQIDAKVTVLVGMNEAGKTVFLQALHKSRDALHEAAFAHVEDYPRKDLNAYNKIHATTPAEVSRLTYKLSDIELKTINDDFGLNLDASFTILLEHKYDNKSTISLDIPEQPVIGQLLKARKLSSDFAAELAGVKAIRDIPALREKLSLTEEDMAFITEIEGRVAKAKAAKWPNVIAYEVWQSLSKQVPRFMYFSEYDVLPSKINLRDLKARVESAKVQSAPLPAQHRGMLALLRMADISLDEIASPSGYETLKAKIEAVYISLTDQIMEFWKQNEDLEVEVDIKDDPNDEAPYNNGPNLYLRIKNRKHRGVSTPFAQRSRGFVWFFSFLVWFDSVKNQMDNPEKVSEIILLLDEPGLALHALAQADFLKYIDKLATKHQVIYTTHSPFMIHSDRLHQVRIVEDQATVGTIISDNVIGSDPRTIFPLQAALGWTIAQNLFISERNLLVEGPSDLIYLKAVSAHLEAQNRTGLREDVTIVPAGGLDKVSTFIALLGANGLKLAVLHDFRGVPDQRIMEMVRQKMISPKAVLNASQFRDLTKLGQDGMASDTEDLISPSVYLDMFNQAFAKVLSGHKLDEAKLPAGERIIDRIERYLSGKNLQLRPNGGYNHYAVASHFASHPPASYDDATLNRFEALFKTINSLFP